MTKQVPKDSIDVTVVNEWARMVRELAAEKNYAVDDVKPFPRYKQTFPEILQEVKKGSDQGIKFYQKMVKESTDYYFKK